MLPSAHHPNSTMWRPLGYCHCRCWWLLSPISPTSGKPAWVINGIKLLNGHHTYPKRTVASACEGDGGKEAREEAEENDPLDDESDGRADVCLTHAGIKCSWRVDKIHRTDWLWHSWQHASDRCHYMRFHSKKQKWFLSSSVLALLINWLVMTM